MTIVILSIFFLVTPLLRHFVYLKKKTKTNFKGKLFSQSEQTLKALFVSLDETREL